MAGAHASELLPVRRGGARAWARAEALPWVEAALESGSLYEAAERTPGSLRLLGRGPVFAIPVPVGGQSARPGPTPEPAHGAPGRWVVRHYRRGGAVARVLGDLYLRVGTPRPVRELRASEAARARGVPTPPVMAAAVYPRAAFYRGDIVTAWVPGSRSLADVLFRAGGGTGEEHERLAALRAAGRLLADLAAAGVMHADLNAGNVLLAGPHEDPGTHLVDLDRCRIGPRGSPRVRRALLRRLLRSLAKLGKAAGRPLSHLERQALVEGSEERP